jgi:hypothetical protein
MPRLKETHLQIVERNSREIRHRTAIRLAQLPKTSAHEDEDSDEERNEEENITDEDTFVQDNRISLIVFLFIVLFILLVIVHYRLRYLVSSHYEERLYKTVYSTKSK